MKTIRPWLIASMLAVATINADAVPVIYTDKDEYMSALDNGGYEALHEKFEDDGVWAASRSSISRPGSTPQVNSQGILWTSNFATNNISTSEVGVAGSFGFYSSPHGNQAAETNDAVCEVEDPIPMPEECFLHDGFVGTSEGAGTLYGVGGWINGTFGADVTLFLDGVEVDFGADGNISSWTFLGVIDMAGFNAVEFRETDGKGGEVVSIRADDVTFGVSASPVPSAADVDGDEVVDSVDNCTQVPNAAQRDSDLDGYGNRCDPDLSQDGTVDSADLSLFKLAFASTTGSAKWNAAADFNGDGVVNSLDVGIMKQYLTQPPGPSGIVLNAADVDEDGVPDSVDNCTVVPNSDQLDTDEDSYGNRCDPDLDNNLFVDIEDAKLLKPEHGSTEASDTWNPAADFNGDGVVDQLDVGVMKQYWKQPPGPSGTL